LLSDALKQRYEWLRNVPARTAMRYFNQPKVRERLGAAHAAALELYWPELPTLTRADRAIVEQLNQCGIAVADLETLGLPNGSSILDQCQSLAEGFSEEAHRQCAAGKQFVIVPPEQVVASPDIFQWGLQDRLLDIAEAYIGLPAAYDGVTINYTVADGRAISTRRWHRDWEDRRMLKLALYLHDVDEQGGPFQVLARADTMQSDADGYHYELADDAELERRLGPKYESDIVSCTGKRGMMIFADTARLYHRGKPATGRDRAAVFYTYFAQPPRHPFYCERTGMRRGDMRRLARDLPERQRKAVAWREHVPFAVRMIPPATL